MKTAGLLIAGGRSSRYGKQKLFETYKNEPLFMKSVRAMREAGIDDVYVITNKDLASHFQDISIICEQTPFEGPLYALYEGMTRLSTSGFSHFQVLAGDLPEIDASMVKYLLNTATAHEFSDILLPEHLGRLQPLHGLYHRRCLPLIENLLPTTRKMSGLYEQAVTRTVPFADDSRYFININRQTDWRE